MGVATQSTRDSLSEYGGESLKGTTPLKSLAQKIAFRQSTASFLAHFGQDESGQDLIEYALLAALVASGSVAGTQNLALKIVNTFTSVQNTITNSIPTSGSGNSGSGSGGSGYGGRDGGRDHH